MSCFLCQQNLKEIDWKNTQLLKKYISGLAKIKNKKKTGLCSSHQRKVARAIKRSRYAGLLPFTVV